MTYPEEYKPEQDIKAITKTEVILKLCDDLHSDICHELFRDKIETKEECEALQDAMQSLRNLCETMQSYANKRQIQ